MRYRELLDSIPPGSVITKEAAAQIAIEAESEAYKRSEKWVHGVYYIGFTVGVVFVLAAQYFLR